MPRKKKENWHWSNEPLIYVLQKRNHDKKSQMSICWLMMVMYDGTCSFCSEPTYHILGIQYYATYIFFFKKKVKFVSSWEKKRLRREKQNHWNGKWTCYSSHLYFSVEKPLIRKGVLCFEFLQYSITTTSGTTRLIGIYWNTSIRRPPWFCQNKFHNLP